ncbi:MAG: GspE/PulE family protein [Patescibacteria group bacterium]
MQKTFPDFLIQKGLIDSLKIIFFQKEAERLGVDIQEVILNSRVVKEGDFFKAKAEFFEFPFFAFQDLPNFSNNVLAEIPEEAAKNYKILSLRKFKDTLDVGMVNPEDIGAMEALNFIATQRKVKVNIFVITLSDFNKFIGYYRTFKGEVKEAMEDLRKELEEVGGGLGKKRKIGAKNSIAEEVLMEAPISKMVAVIIKHATEGRASDIHIEPMEQNLRVRFRVDGVLRASLVLPSAVHSAIVSRIKILSNLKIDESRIPQDGRFHTVIGSKKIDFRVSTFPTANGEKVVMRILDSSVGFLKLQEIGLDGRNLELIRKEIEKPFGMILITGPTGSGKSTTLYSLLNILNHDDINIVSLEDPVEYYMDGVAQSQIKPEIGYSFASGLRHILRQDPDVIMVGEIRDSETAKLAVHAALTGHIVLSTLHTNNAIGVIPRLLDMDIEPFLLPPSLNLMIAQRLVRRLCMECREEIKPSPAIEEMIQSEVDGMPDNIKKEIKKPFKIYKASGCKSCISGAKGRIAIFEAIDMTKPLEEIIVGSFTESNIRKETERQGMITMKQDGILKVLKGIVGIDEVLRATED